MRCVLMRVAAAAGLHRQLHESKIDEKRTNWRWGSFTAIPFLRPADCRASGNCKPCCQVSQLAFQLRNYKWSLTAGYRKFVHVAGCNSQLWNGKRKANLDGRFSVV